MSRKWNSPDVAGHAVPTVGNVVQAPQTSQVSGYAPQIVGFAPSQQSSELSRTGAAILAALTDATEDQTKAGKRLRPGSVACNLFDRCLAVVAQGPAASETELRELARAVLDSNRDARDADALSVEARASYERLQAALRMEEAEALGARLRSGEL